MLKMQQKVCWSPVNAIYQTQSDNFGITIILYIHISDCYQNIIFNPILFEACCEISVRSSARASSDE